LVSPRTHHHSIINDACPKRLPLCTITIRQKSPLAYDHWMHASCSLSLPECENYAFNMCPLGKSCTGAVKTAYIRIKKEIAKVERIQVLSR
jgi:hypothetical protein